jgi:hypothetical protein
VTGSTARRKEARKFKRLPIRFGLEEPSNRANAIQVSAQGAFIEVSRPVYKEGNRIVIEFKTSEGELLVPAVVKFAKNIPLQLSRQGRSGMGVEFLETPAGLADFIKSL